MNIKINKYLSQIECFQCFLSTKNSNSVSFSFAIKSLACETDNRTVSDKHCKVKILAQNK